MASDPALHLSPRFTHRVTGDDAVVLVGDSDSLLLDRPEVAEVVAAVDGTRSAVEVAEHLEGRVAPAMTHFVILRLVGDGVLEEGEAVEGAMPSPTDALTQAWATRAPDRRWCRIPRFAWETDLLVGEDYLDDALVELADASRPVVLARLGSDTAWIGPRIGLPSDPCVECLQTALRRNLKAHAFVHGPKAGDHVHIERLDRNLPASVLSRGQAALRSVIAATPEPPTEAIWVTDPGGDTTRHPARRRPQCPRCGDPTLSVAGPDLPEWRGAEGVSLSGGVRTRHPEETATRLDRLISPITGAIRHVRKVPVAGTDLIHVYTAGHCMNGGPPSIESLGAKARDHAGGKGRTDMEARVSAMCEAVERFSAVHDGTEPTVHMRRSDLDGPSLAPNDLLLFSERQFRDRDSWNPHQHSGFHLVPDPYEDEAIGWCPMRVLGTERTVFVPGSFVFLGYRGEGARYCKSDSNGLSAGNDVAEAIVQGYLELVERDAVALWWYNRLMKPSVDLEPVDDPYIADVQEYYAGLHRRLWVLDLTTDLGIPCLVAVSDRATDRGGVIFGFGAHFDPAIALTRAITELNQTLPTVLQTAERRREQLLPDYPDAVEWWEDATTHDHDYLTPDPSASSSPVMSGGTPRVGLEGLVDACVASARSLGSDLLVYDLSRPDTQLSVVRVAVPGLRHFWRRLGPGRLYDLPVEMGWRASPTAEADMNPVSVFV